MSLVPTLVYKCVAIPMHLTGIYSYRYRNKKSSDGAQDGGRGGGRGGCRHLHTAYADIHDSGDCDTSPIYTFKF